MAYQNEFSHVDNSELNLDWLLNQYATFNDRIAEIQAHFDEVAAEMAQSNTDFKNEINQAFNEFKTEVERESYNVERTIETITNNMTEYVGEHITEWQIQSSRVACPISDYIGEVAIPNVLSSEHDLVIDSIFYAYRDPETDILFRYILPSDVCAIRLENGGYTCVLTTGVRTATAYIQYHII